MTHCGSSDHRTRRAGPKVRQWRSLGECLGILSTILRGHNIRFLYSNSHIGVAIVATVFYFESPATACACCIDPGESFHTEVHFSEETLDQILPIEFTSTTIGEEKIEYRFNQRWESGVCIFEMHRENGESGILLLAPETVAFILSEGSAGNDPHGDHFKEVAIEGALKSYGSFSMIDQDEPRFRLIFRGRGNACYDGTDYETWTLQVLRTYPPQPIGDLGARNLLHGSLGGMNLIRRIERSSSPPLDAFPGLVLLLEDARLEVRASAIRLSGRFARLKPEIVPMLLSKIGDTESMILTNAVEALIEAGEPLFLPQITEMEGDENPRVRSGILNVIARIKFDTSTVIPLVIRMLDDREISVRVAAVAALPALSLSPDSLVALAARRLSDEEYSVRFEAVKILHAMNPPAESALEPLLALGQQIKDQARGQGYNYGSPFYMFERIVQSLAAMGGVAETALVELSATNNYEARIATLEAISQYPLPSSRLFEVVASSVQDTPTMSSMEAVLTLGVIANRNPEGLKILDEVYRRGDPFYRQSVLVAAGSYQGDDSRPVAWMMEALQDTNNWGNRLRALGWFSSRADNDSSVLMVYRRLLADPNETIRRNVSEAFLRFGPRSIPTLLQALSEEDILGKQTASLALGWFGPAASEAIPQLERLAAQGHPWASRDLQRIKANYNQTDD